LKGGSVIKERSTEGKTSHLIFTDLANLIGDID